MTAGERSTSQRTAPSNGQPSPWSPFGHRAFALLWSATLISNIGTWMHDVGAGWLMTSLAPSPAVVSLVQAATTLPVFLFALLAGTLADRMDKRMMLIAINAVLAAIVVTLAVLVQVGTMTPALLLVFTFAIGTGAAFMAPAWQAVVPSLVPRESLQPAIALNSMGINISRAIGPALAGFLIASLGIAAPFFLNAASFLIIIGSLLLWSPPRTTVRPTQSVWHSMFTGVRHVRHNGPLKATLLRALAFFLFASAYWALLPLIARDIPGGGAELYGILLGLLGGGAIAGALALPRLRRSASADHVALAATIGTALAIAILALAEWPWLAAAGAALGGFSWIAMLTTLNVSAQTALPNWVRARGLAVFLMVFFGSMSAGSALWGQVATATSLPTALLIAAAGLLIAMVLVRKAALGQGEVLDLSPAMLWPAPPSVPEGGAADRRGPVLVTVEYKISGDRREEFLRYLYDFVSERLRDGAVRWNVFESLEEPNLWIESFEISSWAEHIAQHERVTVADSEKQARLRQFDTRESGPVVRHYLAPA